MIIATWIILSIITYLMLRCHPIWRNNRLGAYLMILISPIGLLAFILDVVADKYEKKPPQGASKGKDCTVFEKKRNQGFDEFIDGL